MIGGGRRRRTPSRAPDRRSWKTRRPNHRADRRSSQPRVSHYHRRCRSHPCLAWQPQPQMAMPYEAPPPLALRGRPRSPASEPWGRRSPPSVPHHRSPSGLGSRRHRASESRNRHRDSRSRNLRHRACGSGCLLRRAFGSGSRRHRASEYGNRRRYSRSRNCRRRVSGSGRHRCRASGSGSHHHHPGVHHRAHSWATAVVARA